MKTNAENLGEQLIESLIESAAVPPKTRRPRRQRLPVVDEAIKGALFAQRFVRKLESLTPNVRAIVLDVVQAHFTAQPQQNVTE